MKREDNLEKRQRGFSIATAIWILVLLGLAGIGAFFFVPTTNPDTPRLMSPEDAIIVTQGDPETVVQLRWSQGGAGAWNSPQPRPATRMVICAYEGSPGASCGGIGSTAPMVRLNLPVNRIRRTAIQHGPLLQQARNVLDPGFEYQHPLSIPSSSTARELEWTVGACAGPGVSNCSFRMPGRRLGITDVNLRALDLDDHPTTDDNGRYAMHLVLVMDNNGTQVAGPFTAFTQVWRIRADNQNEAMLNLNDETVHHTDRALLMNGRVVPVSDAPQDKVIGIIPGGTIGISWTREFGGFTEGLQEVVAPCDEAECKIALWSPYPPSGTFFLFAAVTRIDEHNAVMETNEGDNLVWKNNIRFFVP